MSFIDNLERGNAISQTLSITSTADASSITNDGALTVAGVFSYMVKVTTFPDSVFTVSFL